VVESGSFVQQTLSGTQNGKDDMPMPGVSMTTAQGTTQQSRTLRQGNLALGGAGQGLQMNALVPIRSNMSSVGVVFIEDIGNRHGRDTAYCRQELDQFGSQLGLMIERKTGLSTSSEADDGANAIYQPASYTLE